LIIDGPPRQNVDVENLDDSGQLIPTDESGDRCFINRGRKGRLSGGFSEASLHHASSIKFL
jgi:hypothetical protein